MNDKIEVIANMRWYLKTGNVPRGGTIEAWANALEQDEQQTPASPEGQGCAGESSVQPAALHWSICDAIREEAELARQEMLAVPFWRIFKYGEALARAAVMQQAWRIALDQIMMKYRLSTKRNS
ncbi:MAG: hypothetical protein IPH59_11755 [bacterium]|nr:hypothetical protein [bacterium]